MITGSEAFAGKTSAVIYHSILSKQPTPPEELNPAIPPRLAEIIQKALEKDPAMRYQTAAEMREDLKVLRQELDSGIVTPPISRASSSTLPRAASISHKKIFTGVAAAVVVVGLLAAAIWFFPAHRAHEISSIAVLPFVDATPDSGTEYLSDGIAQSLIDNLSRLRSEEHTSELQSPDHLVCRLLLEKKKNSLIDHTLI